MRHRSTRRWGFFVTAALAVQVSGCGTLFYPERKGQEGGKVDAKVAILDGIGLLFFIIPGVIAFIVDFDNGTIYLPGTFGGHDSEHHNLFKDKDARLDAPDAAPWTGHHVGPGSLDAAAIRAVVGRNTGKWIDLDDPNMRITKVASVSDLPVGSGEGTR